MTLSLRTRTAIAALAAMLTTCETPLRAQTTSQDWFRLAAELDRQWSNINNEPDRKFIRKMINQLAVDDALPTLAEQKWLLSIKTELDRRSHK